MMIKKYKNTALMILFFVGCLYSYSSAQTYKEPALKYNIAMMNNIYQQVKTYHSQPIYTLQFGFGYCAIDVKLNDEPIFDRIQIDEGFSQMNLPINPDILSSGKQILTVKIFNPDKKLKESDSVWLEARILEYDEKGEFDTVNTLVKFKPPKKNNDAHKEVADFEGKDSVTYTLEFSATVPYKLNGWSNSQDLRKIPDIEQKVKDFYNLFREKFAAHDSAFFANVMYKKEVEIAQSMYLASEWDSKKRWEDMVNTIKDEKTYEGGGGEGIEDIYLKDFKLEFYCEGKLASWVYKGDVAYNARGIIYFTPYEDVNGVMRPRPFVFPLYLHMPEGSTELEVIR